MVTVNKFNNLTNYEKDILNKLRHVQESHRPGIVRHFDNLLKMKKK